MGNNHAFKAGLFVNIGIIGLGYIGLIKCVCFSALGNTVYGFDNNPSILSFIEKGIAPFYESKLQKLLSQGVNNRSIRTAESLSDLVVHSQIIMVCIGTPSSDVGGTDLSQLIKCCSQIGHEIRNNQEIKYIVICSTTPPLTIRHTIIPTVEQTSNLKHGVDFVVLYHPEFLREGSGISDFFNPPYIIVGQDEKVDSADILMNLYIDLPGTRAITSYEVAETIKYGSNLFHAVKITFANEMGLLCKSIGVDSREVLKLLCCDKKLNISDAYLKPGLAFGGSCLPKDIRSTIFLAESRNIQLRMLDAILPSNCYQLRRIVQLLESLKHKDVGIIGLSFKSGSDDLRESPSLSLANSLLNLGYNLAIYDEKIEPHQLANSKLVAAATICNDISDIIKRSKVLIVTQYPKDLVGSIENSGCAIIDVLGSDHSLARLDGYFGLYW